MIKKKTKAKKDKSAEMDLGGGKGVAALSIPAIDQAVDRYEAKKDARCNASPAEIAAKGELRELLSKHREELPKNEHGQPFYRRDMVDYILEEKMKRHRADDGSVRQESL